MDRLKVWGVYDNIFPLTKDPSPVIFALRSPTEQKKYREGMKGKCSGSSARQFHAVMAMAWISASVSSRLPLFTDPGPRVVEKIIIDMIEHAVRTQVNEHHAGNLPDDQQPLRIPTACEASVRQILLVKLITLFIVVSHGSSHS